MEDINEIKQEELRISEHSSKKAMNGELIISCDEIGLFGVVDIRVSIPGRGKTKSNVLKVGESMEYEEKHFYKVTLLTINKKDNDINDNSITVLVSKQKLQEAPELQENIIRESETSRKRIFQELINKHCTNLSACKFKYYEHYLDVKEKGFFKGNIIFKVWGGSLFSYKWNDISIEVYRSLYFDDLIKVAREYSQLTGKKTSVERCF